MIVIADSKLCMNEVCILNCYASDYCIHFIEMGNINLQWIMINKTDLCQYQVRLLALQTVLLVHLYQPNCSSMFPSDSNSCDKQKNFRRELVLH